MLWWVRNLVRKFRDFHRKLFHRLRLQAQRFKEILKGIGTRIKEFLFGKEKEREEVREQERVEKKEEEREKETKREEIRRREREISREVGRTHRANLTEHQKLVRANLRELTKTERFMYGFKTAMELPFKTTELVTRESWATLQTALNLRDAIIAMERVIKGEVERVVYEFQRYAPVKGEGVEKYKGK